MTICLKKIIILTITLIALYLSGCSSDDNHQVNPFDVTNQQVDTDIVGTWIAELAYNTANFELTAIPLDSETTITMNLNPDKTIELTNQAKTINEKGTWGTRDKHVLTVNLPGDSLSTNYNLFTNNDRTTMLYTLYFARKPNEPFMILFWKKMQ